MPDLEHFRATLTRLQQELARRIDAVDADLRHEGMTSDWEDQAQERENDEVLESLGNASEVELAQVNSALRRIDAGQYFVCSQCGEAIPSARLELIPFTSLCVDCAERAEH